MTCCANGHEPIHHDEFHCPLCAALQDATDTATELDRAEDTISDLRARVEELNGASIAALEADVPAVGH
jgi:hypothetical protein